MATHSAFPARSTAAELKKRWVGREEQIDKMVSYLGPAAAAVPPIFVSGPASSGKTRLMRDLFKSFGLKHAYVNCVECATPRAVSETILDQLFDHVPSASNKYSSIAACPDLSQLVVLLSARSHLRPKYVPPTNPDQASSSEAPGTISAEAAEAWRKKEEEDKGWGPTEYIILDNAERLRGHAQLLPALLRLDELCKRNFCTVLVTNVVRDGFEHILCTRPVLSLHLPPYTTEHLSAILLRDPSPDPSVHKALVQLVLNVHGGQGLDLLALRRLLRQLHARASLPQVQEALSTGDQARLYRLLRQDLRLAAAVGWEEPGGDASSRGGGRPVGEGEREMLDVELPYYSKHLLVAAFLASFSPPARDLATFSLATTGPIRRKKRGGCRKIGGRKGGKKDSDPLLEAPSTFGLERWLAIFYTLVIDPVQPNVEILSQIAGLVSLGLVRRVGGDGVRDTKYACQASFPMVKGIGADLRLELGKFIHYD